MTKIKLQICLILILCQLSIVGALSQGTIDTIYTTSNEARFLQQSEDRLAWVELVDQEWVIMLLENNSLDTIFAPENTEIYNFHLTENSVAWEGNALNIPTVGHCSRWVTSTNIFSDGVTHIDSVPCGRFITSDNYIIRTFLGSEDQFQIINNKNEVIFSLPPNYQGHELIYSRNIRIVNDFIFFNSNEYDEEENLIEGIYKFNLKTFHLDKLYVAPENCDIKLGRTTNDQHFSFVLSCSEDDPNRLYLYENDTITHIDTSSSSYRFHQPYKDGIIFGTSLDYLLYKVSNQVDTLSQNFGNRLFSYIISTTGSECFYSWRTLLTQSRELVFSVFNGSEIKSVNTNFYPYRDDNWHVLNNDGLYDIVKQDSTYKILQFSYNLNCEQEVSTSIKDNQINAISIYPNPTQEILNISNKESDKYEVIIYDLSGKSILSYSNTNQINIKALPNGIYIIHILETNMDIAFTGKFVKL